MRKLITCLIAGGFFVIGGCASTAESPDKSIKFHVSERAQQLLEEQGKTLAAMRGYDRDSPLVCEQFQKTGSHIKINACYTRKEMEQRRLGHQENYRKFSTPGGKCIEGASFGGIGGERGVANARGAWGEC